jgi:L-arabinonolactonase
VSVPRFELLAVPDRDLLGEGPWWDLETGFLHWVDIEGRRIRRARLDGTGEVQLATSTEVGFVVPTTHGSLLSGLRDGLFEIDPVTGAATSVFPADYDAGSHRINDGKTDRRGRVWFGTKHDPELAASSAFYRYDADGVERVFDGFITSNGLGWSPDDTVMYHTDTLRRTIFAYDFDAERGVLSGRRVFAEDPDTYVPDGLTVDSEGFLWAAKWDGGLVVRYAPDGSVADRLEMPVSRPTSCMFVGDSLDTLAVTSAAAPERDEPLAGSVFLIDAGVSGLPERRAEVPGAKTPHR